MVVPKLTPVCEAFLILMIALTSLNSVYVLSSDTETGSLKVVVIDTDGNPITGAATQSIKQPEGQTSLVGPTGTLADGSMTFSDVLVGNYTLRAHYPSFYAGNISVNVAAAATTEAIIILRAYPPPGNLMVLIQDSNGDPIPYGQATVITWDGWYHTKTAERDGTAFFANVTAGEAMLKANEGGYMEANTTISIPPGSTLEVTMTLQTTILGSLKVVVRDSNGSNLSGVNVISTSQPGDQPPLSGVSDDQGAVFFKDILQGSYTLQASKSGYPTGTETTNVIGGSSRTAHIFLSTTGNLKIKVMDYNYVPIAGATVKSLTQPSGQTQLNGLTGADGTVNFTVSTGGYTLSAEMSGYVSVVSEEVTVKAGLYHEMALTLQPKPASGGFVVVVKDMGGSLLSGASVSTTSQPSGQAQLTGTTGADGTVAFTGVLPGTYTVQVSKTGFEPSSLSRVVEVGSSGSVSFSLQAQQSGGGGVPGFPLETIAVGVLLCSLLIGVRRVHARRFETGPP